MFDLPDPFGPTTTETPGENSRRVRSGKDLKPLSVTDFRCIPRTRSFHRLQRRRRSRLLGVLLGPAAAGGDLVPSTTAATRKVRSCGGPSSPRTS
jgi:hypothetical protein